MARPALDVLSNSIHGLLDTLSRLFRTSITFGRLNGLPRKGAKENEYGSASSIPLRKQERRLNRTQASNHARHTVTLPCP